MSFKYYKNQLCLKRKNKTISLLSIVKKQNSPLYIYDLKGMCERLQFFKTHTKPAHPHYAIKANSHPSILKAFCKEGAGVDVVSEGEIQLALKAGFKGQDIVFSGVAKTTKEISLAIKKNILQINVESISELKKIAKIAKKMRKKTPVAFRMNPDINAKTHPYIKTGLKENKFGIEVNQIPYLKEILNKERKHLELKGLSLHIGSQIQNLTALKQSILKVKPLYQSLQKEFALKTLDIGGGLGIDYKNLSWHKDLKLIKEYGSLIKKISNDINTKILTEPGRIITARFGCLIGKIEYIKTTAYKNFVILNTGMNHLIRPCLYQAYHRILPLKKDLSKTSKVYDVAGPICESSDIIGKDRLFSDIKEGDFMAILDTGAYGAVMANQYNSYPLAKELTIS